MKTDNSKNSLWLIATLVIGLIAVFPQTVYQPFLLQGDHGRDLYIFQQTAQGAVPYRDYRTSNGPLMPYYYAVFLNIFGPAVQSVLLGYAVLIFAAGLLIYFISLNTLSPGMAWLTALWYWAWRGQEFFYTFNHIGAVALSLCAILFLFKHLRTGHSIFFIGGLLSSLLCLMVRPNIGLASLTALLICLACYRPNFDKRMLLVALGLIVFFVIGLIIFITPSKMIGLISTYWNAVQWERAPANIVSLVQMWRQLAMQNIPTALIWIFFISASLRGIFLIFIKKTALQADTLRKTLICLSIFFILFLLEYLLGFRFFRWVWVLPVGFLIVFHLTYAGLNLAPRPFKITIFVLLTISCLMLILSQYAEYALSRNHHIELKIGKSHVVMGMNQRPWIQTVTATADFITTHSSQDEFILTIPYDALYAFLSHRNLAVKNPNLFGNPGNDIIQDIENKRVRIIVLSNRAFHHNEEAQFGIFGKTYGESLWDYIQNHYELTEQIGPWNQIATPIFNHATRIYLRNTPFSSEDAPRIGSKKTLTSPL